MVAKKQEKSLRVTGIKPSTIGMLQGTLFFLFGLATAIMFTFSNSLHLVNSTESLLRGLTFGLASGFVAIICTPIIYFMVGWVFGWIQGFLITTLVRMSGGIVVKTEEE